LALALRDSQRLLLGMMLFPIVERPGPQSPQQQAVLALSQHAYKLSRCADLTLSAGYALPSIPTVRAIYERVATALYARTNEQFAKDLIEGKLRQRDVQDFATRAKEYFPDLLDEYLDMRRQPAFGQSDVDKMKADIPKLYGMLSDFAHPRNDANQWYFLVDPSTGKALLAYLPDEEASPFTILLLLFLLVLQFMLQTLLVMEFHDEGNEKWELLHDTWEKSVAMFASQIEANMEVVNEYLQE